MTTDTPPVVLIDCNYLCYRAFYSQGHLTHAGQATGVVFGFMRAVKDLEARWPLCRPVFCWDYGKGLREQEFEWYKKTRREKRKEERKDKKKRRMWDAFQEQVEALRDQHLRRVGYRNILKADGYEADDVIASVIGNMNDRFVIVSGDEDLFQLLRKGRVQLFQPKEKKLWTEKTFQKEFKIIPEQWAVVKALAGCKSDDIPGVKGVAEKTAIKYLLGEVTDKVGNKIDEFRASKKFERNCRLVALPYHGCPAFDSLKKDRYNINGWNDLMSEIGASSMLQKTTPWGGSEAIF